MKLDRLLGRWKTFVSVKTSFLVLSFDASLILTFPLPGKISSELDSLTFVEFSVKSMISLLLL